MPYGRVATNLGIRAIWLNRHNLPCPNPMLATEITAFEPRAMVIQLLLNNHVMED
ncbi:MAG: hypothetical protein NT075_03325 [Chloroflexi bacterium]|nr:hypothetical protein [Chloroflexota bacterium]